MTVVINGTSGITDVNGSAASPAITGTDTDTGVFFGTNTVSLSTNGTERLQIDSSGNAGLGVTPSAWKSTSKALQVNTTGGFSSDTTYGTSFSDNVYLNSGTQWIRLTGNGTTTGLSTVYGQVNGAHYWYNAPVGSAGTTATLTQAMTLDASGKLLVGWTTAPTASASVIANGIQCTNTSGGGGYLMLGTSGGGQQFYTHTGVSGSESYTERMRIDSSGNLMVGTSSLLNNERLNVTKSINLFLSRFSNTATSGNAYGIQVVYPNVTPNNADSAFHGCYDGASVLRFAVYSNGGIANYSANNVNLSDRREKTNFAPAGDYLDKICAIPVQTFNYIDQNLEEDDGLTLGVVAQDVQAVAPELVMESNWGTQEEPKMRLSIYQTDLQYALMKCIQEQQAIIEQLQADVAALKG